MSTNINPDLLTMVDTCTYFFMMLPADALTKKKLISNPEGV